MSARLRTFRTWPTDPDQPNMPDVGDVLQTAKQGVLYLVHAARPTRGHPLESRRLTLQVERLNSTDDVPPTAVVFILSSGRPA